MVERSCEIEVVADIALARVRWEAMEATGVATPFQSYAWVSAMARTLGRAAGAEFLAVFAVEPATGRDLMLLPLVRRRLGAFTLLESPDFGLTDYCGPLLSREIAEAPARFAPLWRDTLAALPKADLLRLGKVPAALDGRPNALLQAGGPRPKPGQSWSVALPDRWADYEANVLSPKVRRNLRRSERLLSSGGTVAHAVAATEAEVDRAFAAMLAQRRLRFARIGRHDSLGDPGAAAFYRLLLVEGLATGLASLATLTLDGEIVATLLGLHWRDRFLALIPTMTEDLPKGQAPGKVMTAMHLRHVQAGGCRLFDFTTGDEPYKRDFGAVPGRIYELNRPLTSRGRLVALGIAMRTTLKTWRHGSAGAADAAPE